MFGLAVFGQAQETMKGEMMKSEMIKFTVRIENISSPDGMKASDGTQWPFAMSPGLCIVHTNNAPVFSSGKIAAKGLRRRRKTEIPPHWPSLSKGIRV
jgi:hypothetical protein